MVEQLKEFKGNKLFVICDSKPAMSTRAANVEQQFWRDHLRTHFQHGKWHEQLKLRFQDIEYVWLKGHAGITENEIVDKAAKKEARCTISVGVENPRSFPEIAVGGMMIERKNDLERAPRVLQGYAVSVMKRVRSKVGKMSIMGAEQWWGHQIPKAPEEIDCSCGKSHPGDFYGIIKECKEWESFRKMAKFEWTNRTGAPFVEEMLWGRIRTGIFKGLEKQYEHGAYKMVGGYLKWWENKLKERKKAHSKNDSHRVFVKRQEDGLVKDCTVRESGKISEQEAELEFPDDNLHGFRVRLKLIEDRAMKRHKIKKGM